jgi:hypothetical protein
VFTTPLLSQVLTLDEESGVITHFFSSAQNYRYWRLFIDDPGNPYGHLEISQVIISSSTAFECAVGVGFKYSLEDNTKSQETAFGQRYYDVLPSSTRIQFDVPLATYADTETLIDLVTNIGSAEAIGVNIDSLADAFDKDRFFVYGNIQKNFEVTHTQGNYFNTSFSVEELA